MNKVNIKLLLTVVASVVFPMIKVSAAGDSLVAQTNKQSYNRADTIYWHCELPHFNRSSNAVTIQLWIESLNSNQTWHYRYPMINGASDGALVVPDNIPEGRYAINFVLQKTFFNITGKVRDARKKDTALRYMIIANDKETLIKTVRLSDKGRFEIGKYLFQDTALFIFSPIKNKSTNDLWIDIATSLDSSFVASSIVSQIITVGNPTIASPNNSPSLRDYHFNFEAALKNNTQLQEVVVSAKSHKLLDDFVKDQVSSRFMNINDLNFDGLDNSDISRSPDLFTFIMAHAPGLSLQTDGETGMQELFYRNSPVTIFINEFKTEGDAVLTINPGDVALIKVMRPGYSMVGGPGGAIAIYMKTGTYTNSSTGKYTFKIRGYNPALTIWE